MTILSFSLSPLQLHAETPDFLRATVTAVERSAICANETCQTLFLISGKNFLNSNGDPEVRVGDEWAEVIRSTNTFLAAVASQDAYEKTPVVAVDTTLVRPRLLSEDDILVSMFEESLDVALASIGVTEAGMRYVTAGPKYGSPTRIYYRDTYWTSGLILMIEPYVIRDQIRLLASGVEANGRAPSAIPLDANDSRLSLWVDHVDSGPYFVMLVYDYVRWTGDTSILRERVGQRSVFAIMEDAMEWLATKDKNDNLLPEKGEGSLQDWLDSIPRSGEVLSNEVLYYRALRNLVELAELLGESERAEAFHRQSLLVRYQINQNFWNEEEGYYYESCYQGVCEERITNESALAILYDVASKEQRERLFESLRTLESAENSDIPGDWGVLNAWPLYDGFTPYDYQNGTDWPFLDGINAGARLKYANADWRYPLTRWWTFNREQNSGRVLPEYVSFVDIDGGDQQAWGVNPIVSFLRYGIGIDPSIDGYFTTKRSPNGDVRIEDIVVRGQRISVEAR